MTNNEIYLTALSLIGESRHNEATADYAARAPKLLEIIGSRLYSLTNPSASGDDYVHTSQSLNDSFTYPDELATPAALFLAAYLVADEDSELYGALYSQAVEMTEEYKRKNVTVSSCREVYPY